MTDDAIHRQVSESNVRLAAALARMVRLTGIAAQGNDYLNLAAALRHARDVLRETGYDWLLKQGEPK